MKIGESDKALSIYLVWLADGPPSPLLTRWRSDRLRTRTSYRPARAGCLLVWANGTPSITGLSSIRSSLSARCCPATVPPWPIPGFREQNLSPIVKLGRVIGVFLLMLVAGVGLAQAVSDPRQVTLRWLRLGGLIAVVLLAVALVIQVNLEKVSGVTWLLFGATSVAFVTQLMTVQLGRHSVQRLAASFGFALAVAVVVLLLAEKLPASAAGAAHAITPGWPMALTMAVSCGLLGGGLMTMLFGHAYLTAGGEMTQSPFMRLVVLMGVLIGLRLVCSGLLGVWPCLAQTDGRLALWDLVMITARYLVGFVAPLVFIFMTFDCVKRRANQSATGILYVWLVMIIIGEGAALALIRSTGYLF